MFILIYNQSQFSSNWNWLWIETQCTRIYQCSVGVPDILQSHPDEYKAWQYWQVLDREVLSFHKVGFIIVLYTSVPCPYWALVTHETARPWWEITTVSFYLSFTRFKPHGEIGQSAAAGQERSRGPFCHSGSLVYHF